MTDKTFQEMTGPEQVTAWNAMVGKAKRKGIEVSPVTKFKDRKIGTERLIKLETKLANAGSVSPAKVGGKKAAVKNGKPRFGHNLTIVSVIEENPRFKNTKAYKLFEKMRDWVKHHKGKTVAQLIEETDYRRQDFDWDVKRKHIAVTKIPAAA